MGCDSKSANFSADRRYLPDHAALRSHIVALALGSLYNYSSNSSPRMQILDSLGGPGFSPAVTRLSGTGFSR